MPAPGVGLYGDGEKSPGILGSGAAPPFPPPSPLIPPSYVCCAAEDRAQESPVLTLQSEGGHVTGEYKSCDHKGMSCDIETVINGNRKRCYTTDIIAE